MKGKGNLFQQKFSKIKVIWPEFPINKSMIGRHDLVYKVGELCTMILTRHIMIKIIGRLIIFGS